MTKVDEARATNNADNDKDNTNEDDSPQVEGEARSAMQDVQDLQDAGTDLVNLQERISMLNPDQLRVFTKIRDHLVHQFEHEDQRCGCNNLKPLHMFFSGVGGTGKSFLIETIRAQVVEIWNQRLACAVAAPTGLAAFNVGGVTIHRLTVANRAR